MDQIIGVTVQERLISPLLFCHVPFPILHSQWKLESLPGHAHLLTPSAFVDLDPRSTCCVCFSVEIKHTDCKLTALSVTSVCCCDLSQNGFIHEGLRHNCTGEYVNMTKVVQTNSSLHSQKQGQTWWGGCPGWCSRTWGSRVVAAPLCTSNCKTYISDTVSEGRALQKEFILSERNLAPVLHRTNVVIHHSHGVPVRQETRHNL